MSIILLVCNATWATFKNKTMMTMQISMMSQVEFSMHKLDMPVFCKEVDALRQYELGKNQDEYPFVWHDVWFDV